MVERGGIPKDTSLFERKKSTGFEDKINDCGKWVHEGGEGVSDTANPFRSHVGPSLTQRAPQGTRTCKMVNLSRNNALWKVLAPYGAP